MASSIVDMAAQVGGLLVDEAKYLSAVTDKIQRLQNELEWMQCFLEDAYNKQHQVKLVDFWVVEIQGFAYEAEDLINRYAQHEVSHPRENGLRNTVKWFSCVLGDARTLHNVGSDIDDLRNRISNLASKLQTYMNHNILPAESSSTTYRFTTNETEKRRTYSHIEEDPVGLGKHIEQVVDQLVTGKEFSVVGVCGMGGLGKTTLARQVYQSEGVKQHFKNGCVWVYVSKQFETRNIFEEILTELTTIGDGDGRMETRALTQGGLPRKICEVLTNNKCLVVLDDIWNNEAWDTLKPAFDSIGRSGGSKILITTRDEGLVKHAKGYSHPFGILSAEDSWRLFLRKTEAEERPDDNTKAKMLELGKEMLKHCKGLPLAIVALGGILSTKKTIVEWEMVQKNITSYLMNDLDQQSGSSELSAVLESSYYDLPFYLKLCFMYLGSFPEDFEISAERLYHLWEAEGLITSSVSGFGFQGGSIDNIAESYLNQLIKRSMLSVERCWLNGRIKSCRLHDVMRDLCLKKCKKVNFLSIVEHGGSKVPSNQVLSSSTLVNTKTRVHRCAVYLSDDIVDDLPLGTKIDNTPCIRSLMVFQRGYLGTGAEKILSLSKRKFFSLLRVLDLEGTQVEELPDIFEDVILLRYLNLRRARISDLPSSIWGCKHLETLDLRCPTNFRLSNMFWKLGCLRHLYLPRLLELRDSRKLILASSQLERLETLKNFDVKQLEIEDLWKMVNLRIFSLASRRSLDKEDLVRLLQSPAIVTKNLVNPLRLPISGEVINEDPSIVTTTKSHVDIGGLRISGSIKDVSLGSYKWLVFPDTLTKLVLSGCEIGQKGISVLEKLPHLKKLYLYGNAIGGAEMSFSSIGFVQLSKLTLWDLKKVKQWKIGQGALPSLSSLNIYKCQRLHMLPEGLPSSVRIQCNPCILGIGNYNTCPYFRAMSASSSSSSIV